MEFHSATNFSAFNALIWGTCNGKVGTPTSVKKDLGIVFRK